MNRDAFAADVPATIKVTDPKELAPLTVDLSTAAKLVGVSDTHLRKFVNVIPHIRVGNRLLFRVDALRDWLASRETIEGGEEHDPQP